jgi:hypothetical protein
MEEQKDYTIELEATVLSLRQRFLKLGYDIMEKFEKGELPSKEIIAEKKFLLSQYNDFNKILKDVKKNSGGGEGSMYDLLKSFKKIELGVAEIQQKIN